MSDVRIEKKFVYQEGDDSYRLFLLNGNFRKIYSPRKINSLYFDTEALKNVWDNINGFGDRTKIRLRWYNNLNNSDVFFEEKIKKNFTTIKKISKIGNFKNFQSLNKFIIEKLNYIKPLIKKKSNINKTVNVTYDREYFIEGSKKLRVTIDKNIKVFLKEPNKTINIDKHILEIKYDPKYSNFINKFLIDNKMMNRNQKFSKYVNSILELNESGLI
tara:strand:+ start:2586 stop:3233 length:648 start_codon:yes stop_codon:yes gene_type:complete